MIRVIKLGGSLLDNEALPACLDAAERYCGQTLLVPGGGVFAEQVRIMQRLYCFDDQAAHRMAILAMQQMAILFKGLKPGFGLFERIEDLSGSGVSIWSPQPDELDSAGIAASWDVTSDSLAAWLAGQSGADELILVKSASISAGGTLPELQGQGIVDAAFTRFAECLDCPITVINKHSFISAS